MQHLMKWNEMTNGDYTNAVITGASPTVHTLWEVNWDCLDRFGEAIPDGNYKIYAEFTEDNSALIPVNGPWTMVEFTKGNQAQTVTPSENQFFQDLSLVYTPAGTSADPHETGNSAITKLDNFPNPFNPETTISYSLSNASNVLMEMYNLKGQKIKTLVSQYLDAGDYSVVWDGNNDLNLPVSSGVYLYRLQTDTDHVIQKCILLK
jgi:flagellar hook assembly protein FlgD